LNSSSESEADDDGDKKKKRKADVQKKASENSDKVSHGQEKGDQEPIQRLLNLQLQRQRCMYVVG
jgi:hypothetical protein